MQTHSPFFLTRKLKLVESSKCPWIGDDPFLPVSSRFGKDTSNFLGNGSPYATEAQVTNPQSPMLKCPSAQI